MSQGAALLYNLLPIVLMIAVFYFLLIRPQQKRQKATMLMQSSLKKGDRIVTIGGLHGIIDSVDEENDTVTIKVASGAHMTFDKNAVRDVTSETTA